MGADFSDLEVVQQYVSGSNRAYKVVDSLLRLAFLKWKNRLDHMEDDLISAAHLKIFNAFQQENFRFTKGLEQFVRFTLNCICIDFIRSADYRNKNDFEDIMEISIPNPEKSVEDRLEFRQAALICYRAIRLAPKICRDIWTQHYIKHKKCAEIAQELNLTASTIRGKLLYCREKVKEIRELLIKKYKHL